MSRRSATSSPYLALLRARFNALLAKTLIMSNLYCLLPCMSEGGSASSLALSAASAMLPSSSVFPLRCLSALLALIGVGATAPNDTLTSLQTPFGPTVTTAPTPTIAKSPSRRLCLMYADPDFGGVCGIRISVRISSFAIEVVKVSTKNSDCGITLFLFTPRTANFGSSAVWAVGYYSSGSAWQQLPPIVLL